MGSKLDRQEQFTNCFGRKWNEADWTSSDDRVRGGKSQVSTRPAISYFQGLIAASRIWSVHQKTLSADSTATLTFRPSAVQVLQAKEREKMQLGTSQLTMVFP